MLISFAVALLALQNPVQAAPVDPGLELLARAREHRTRTDRAIRRYETEARERMSLGLRIAGRERRIVASEFAGHIDWRRRGPITVKVRGARERGPQMAASVPSAQDMRSRAGSLAFDPGADRLQLGVVDTSMVHHPLAPGSERYYRFSVGDTVTVRLPEGQAIRIVELLVRPRRLDGAYLTGSFWLETESYGLVRAMFRPSRPIRESLRLKSGTVDSVRNIAVVVAPSDTHPAQEDRRDIRIAEAELEIRYTTVEYGLVDGRWWLPVQSAVEGTATFAGLGLSFRYERSYSGYRVEGEAPAGSLAIAQEAVDSPVPGGLCDRKNATCRCSGGVCRSLEVEIPRDTASLARSEALPASLATGSGALMSGREIDEIAAELRKVAPIPWILQSPELGVTPLLPRYNRVEGLSVGARADAGFGAVDAHAAARLATAGWEPSLELGVGREGPEHGLTFTAYHGLSALGNPRRAFSPGNSLSAFIWGDDEGDYLRTTGVALRGSPGVTVPQRYGWRIYAERQRSAPAGTDLTLGRLWQDAPVFRPNPPVDRADQLGGSLRLRAGDETRFGAARWAIEWMGSAETGSFRFARSALEARGSVPLSRRVSVGAQLAGGSSVGDVPIQGLWRLGGTESVRGYRAGDAVGRAFWRGRGEIGLARGALGLVLFSDAGWAGDPDAITLHAPLWSVGTGVSLLDGLARVDLARALRDARDWRLSLTLNGLR